MKLRRFEPQFVGAFPSPLNAGVLYVSIEFTTCAHLCACGCGEEVITPLSPAHWSLTYDGRDVSLHPSIGNWSLPCQSHYILDRGSVRWSRQFTRQQIAANRTRDKLALQGHTASTDRVFANDDINSPPAETVWTQTKNRLGRWLGAHRKEPKND